MLHQSDIGQRLICEWMTSWVLMFKVICKVKMTEKYPKTTIFQQNLTNVGGKDRYPCYINQI